MPLPKQVLYISRWRLSELGDKGIHLPCTLVRQARDRLQLIAAGRQESLRGAEMGQDCLFASGPDAGYAVEDGTGHRAIPALPVIGYRKTVSLVADPL